MRMQLHWQLTVLWARGMLSPGFGGGMVTHCVLLLCLASFRVLDLILDAVFMFEIALILLGRCQYF